MQTLYGSVAGEPGAVAIDSPAGRIYWTNRPMAAISYGSLDGSAPIAQFTPTTGGNLFGLAILSP